MFWIRQHKLLVSVALFMILFMGIQFLKPGFLYNRDGSFREFGIGYRNKTIFPIWVFSLCLGILSYMAVLYALETPFWIKQFEL